MPAEIVFALAACPKTLKIPFVTLFLGRPDHLTGCPKTIQGHIMSCNVIRNALFYKELFYIAIYK
jgi:hypothetical protein